MPLPRLPLLHHSALRSRAVFAPYRGAARHRTVRRGGARNLCVLSPPMSLITPLTPHQDVCPSAASRTSRFIAALILPSAQGSGAVAVLDHTGALIISAPLPTDLHRDVLDPEGLLAHLAHFVPNLAAMTDIFVSWLPAPSPGHTHASPRTADLDPPPNTITRLLPLLAWLGPRTHVVLPARWGATQRTNLGTSQSLPRPYCASLSDREPFPALPGVSAAIRAAMLLVHHALPHVRVGNP